MNSDTRNDGGLRMIEFFSGIGGMRLAVDNALQQSARHETKSAPVSLEYCQAYDISLHANRTYKHNFEIDLVSTKLVEQLKAKDLNGKADIWTMSPPCQPFTTTRGAKVLDIDDKRCDGLKGIMRLLTEIEQKPRYIMLENVKGFRTSRMIEKWHECLEQNGYTWREYLVSPIHLGIPNHRQRYYMICERSRRWAGLEHTPQLSLSSSNIADKMRTVAEYINTSLDGEQLADVLVPESTLQQNWAQQLGVVTAADTATHCFTAAYGRIFHKATGSLLLMPDNIDGNVEQQEALAVKPLDRSDMLQYSGRLRRFSPMELLALFGFPSHYEFPSDLNLEQQYKLIGNSINVIVVAELVKELLFGDEESTLVVGGTNGHVPETIDGNLLLLYRSHRWKMIPNCMGRHTCRDHSLVSPLPPLELLERAGIENLDGSRMPETSIQLKEYRLALPGRPDKVVVVPLDSQNRTGLITFIKEGTSYVHTLNTPSGFRRKLEAIGIRVSETDICLAVDADADISS